MFDSDVAIDLILTTSIAVCTSFIITHRLHRPRHSCYSLPEGLSVRQPLIGMRTSPSRFSRIVVQSHLQNFRTYSTSSPAKPSLNVHAASGGPTAPAEYCASLVKKLDRDAWLTSYFWPKRERDWYLAWRAFNVCHPSPSSVFLYRARSQDSGENEQTRDMRRLTASSSCISYRQRSRNQHWQRFDFSFGKTLSARFGLDGTSMVKQLPYPSILSPSFWEICESIDRFSGTIFLN